jgi:hypothetical protein
VDGIGLLKSPPTLEALNGLELTSDEIGELRRCQPSGCDVKLSLDEIGQIRAAATTRDAAGVQEITLAFRRILLERARTYLTNGVAGLPAYRGQPPGSFAVTARALLMRSAFLQENLSPIVGHLEAFPPGAMDIDNFLYWSRERSGGKPVIGLTHVSVARFDTPGLPAVVVVGRQLYASHYMDGSVGITMMVPGAPGGRQYLVYLNRSRLDVLGGMLGGLKKWVIRRRLSEDGTDVLRALRSRMESGDPPGVSGAPSQ